MTRKSNYDWESIHKLTGDAQQQAIRKLARIANQRLRNIEKSGSKKSAYKYVQAYTGNKDKPRFSETTKRKTPYERQRELYELEKFLTAQTSTVSGQKKARNKAIDTLIAKGEDYSKRLQNIDRDLFDEFLSSMEFKELKYSVASEFILDDVTLALSQGETIDKILESYREYLTQNKRTFDQITKRRDRIFKNATNKSKTKKRTRKASTSTQRRRSKK